MDFGFTKTGEKLELFCIRAENIECTLTNYAASIVSIKVKDKNGEERDVLLGMDDGEGYERQTESFGASVGRCANRIAGGRFVLNGKEYSLAVNNGPNHLHGGNKGFNKKVWTVENVSESKVTMSLFSPDGDENYPGNLTARVEYLVQDDTLFITYSAESDQDTVINLTNHAYFNLDGHDSGNVLDTFIKFNADCFTPADEVSIPTGELRPVEGTPMDFSDWHRIGERIFRDYDQLKYGNGYDHNWVINGEAGNNRLAAYAYSEKSGIMMTAYTDRPGMQFYTGNYTGGIDNCKGGVKYCQRAGFCLEMQNFPDRINHPEFPSAVLHSGETYTERISYSFTVKDKI